MIELTKGTKELTKTGSLSSDVVQLSHVKGESVFMSDPEGNRIEIKTTSDGRKIIFTKDEGGRSIALEERENGTKLYHISSDSTGLPSSHEIRPDQTELVYFYNVLGSLQHFVELKPNGDRISTVLSDNGSIFSVEQKQVGGVVFTGFHRSNNAPSEAMIWLHPDGEISTYGDEKIIAEIYSKFSKFLDGVC